MIEALRALTASGRKAIFYPFILMEQLGGNALPDPYGATEQPVMPWRGRVTTRIAPGRPGTTDLTAAAVAEMAAFFGTAGPGDFSRNGETVSYSGPDEWSYRRFILHYAHLCAAAGGIDAFLIGSEMVAMTQIRGPGNSYPAVAALRQLAAPCHLRLEGRRLTWIRRSRVEGDGWDGPDIPLGEDQERYVLQVLQGGHMMQEIQLSAPTHELAQALWADLAQGGPFTVRVAQLSQTFGRGLFVRRDFNVQ